MPVPVLVPVAVPVLLLVLVPFPEPELPNPGPSMLLVPQPNAPAKIAVTSHAQPRALIRVSWRIPGFGTGSNNLSPTPRELAFSPAN